MDIKNEILVTGAAGFIGYHLTKSLLEDGSNVIGIDILNDYYDITLKNERLTILNRYKNFTFYRENIMESDKLNCIFKKHRPQIVINLAAQAGVRYSIDNPRSYIDSNVVGFFNVLEACRHYPVEHLIFASSSSVYGNQEQVPYAVSDNVDYPISLYAATKKSNELMAFTYSHLFNIPVTGLRFFTVYGPFGRPDMAYFSFSNKILAGDPIRVFNKGNLQRDFTFIDDIVDGVKKVMNHIPAMNKNMARYKIYNIGYGKPNNLMYFINLLERYWRTEAKKELLPMQPGDVYQTYADITEIKRELGFCPKVSLEEGLEKFVLWYKDFYHI